MLDEMHITPTHICIFNIQKKVYTLHSRYKKIIIIIINICMSFLDMKNISLDYLLRIPSRFTIQNILEISFIKLFKYLMDISKRYLEGIAQLISF